MSQPENENPKKEIKDLLPAIADAMNLIHSELKKTAFNFSGIPNFRVQDSETGPVLHYTVTLRIPLHRASPNSGSTPGPSPKPKSSKRRKKS